jgi:hypothetical protein
MRRLELRARIDAQLSIEVLANLAIGIEGICLAAGGEECEHQLAPCRLSRRLLSDEPAQSSGRRRGLACRHQRAGSQLLDLGRKVLETLCLAAQEWFVGEVAERAATPAFGCPVDRRQSGFDGTLAEQLACLLSLRGELISIKLAGLNIELVSALP